VRLLRLAAWGLLIAGCGGGPEPVVPADFRTAWAEVRPCQESAEHELQFVRVRADGMAAAAYGDGVGGIRSAERCSSETEIRWLRVVLAGGEESLLR
jgi:hypothetical protein